MISFPSKKRGMKRGFTLIELMVVIATLAVLVALLLPDIQTAKDASLQGQKKEGPYWVYREYEYAGGPVVSEISGSHTHSLQEILDMYAINLKKQQMQVAQDLRADAETEKAGSSNSDQDTEIENSNLSKEEQIKRAKRAMKNFKYDLSQNTASLVARRNLMEAIESLTEDLKRLESEP
ncbi:hypothetical protein V144x_07970 [Gimesia aquarii]|uniref:Major pilin subunit n=2 Tax=Gimesia aquarii TaxID=2527964 RepID=A0A517VQQ2_9PLAN|nr:hypothetical protein V144x_07970 [Gimesia aquarii]